jgi:hypothetical protein
MILRRNNKKRRPHEEMDIFSFDVIQKRHLKVGGLEIYID